MLVKNIILLYAFTSFISEPDEIPLISKLVAMATLVVKIVTYDCRVLVEGPQLVSTYGKCPLTRCPLADCGLTVHSIITCSLRWI